MKITEYPNLVAEWHPTKNIIDIAVLTHGSKRKVWWLGKCGHEFQMRVDSRAGKLKCGCPYCNGNRKSCSLSISHPQVCSEWHPTKNVGLSPENITSGCMKRVWWLGECGHEWEATVRNRTNPQNLMLSRVRCGVRGCPYCANKATDETNCLEAKNPEISAEWHPTKNGDLSPKNVNYSCYDKVWWLGKCGHEWESIIRTRTRKRSAGCPFCCDSKGEIKIAEILKELGLEFETQVRFPDCKDKRSLPFDFKVGNILIEYQGEYHFHPVNYGQKDYVEVFHSVQRHDQIKRDWCLLNGYKLVEIPYTQFDSLHNIIGIEVYHC